MPDIEALAEEFAGRATVYKLDITQFFWTDKALREQFSVDSLPLYLVYKDGKEVVRLSKPENTHKAHVHTALEAALETTDASSKEPTP